MLLRLCFRLWLSRRGIFSLPLFVSQEVNFKVQRQQNVNMRTSIQSEHPWKLQQIQDAANHLQQGIAHIDNVDRHYLFKTSDEVMHVLGNILGCLQRSRTSLIVPRKKTIDDLIKSRNMVRISDWSQRYLQQTHIDVSTKSFVCRSLSIRIFQKTWLLVFISKATSWS